MNKQLQILLFSCILSIEIGFAQTDLSYYLPDKVSFDPAIPTPQSVIGHEVGEWHVSHDRLVTYMHALDQASDRISLEQTGLTYEARPLLLLTITSPKNHQNLAAIQAAHLKLSDPNQSGGHGCKIDAYSLLFGL